MSKYETVLFSNVFYYDLSDFEYFGVVLYVYGFTNLVRLLLQLKTLIS